VQLSEQDLQLNFYKFIIQYKGTNYSGFQIQPTEQTIQGEFNRAIKEVIKSDNFKTIGSGRTDSGVHAIGQVIRAELELNIPPQSFAKALNTKLPPDIRVVDADFCTEKFHPIYSAKSKEYNYVFYKREIPNVFGNELMTHIGFDFDLDLVQKACDLFVGTHDFINFQCTGTDVDSTIREIYKCEVIHYISEGHWASVIPDYYLIRVIGNGFLKQMVRLMVGAIWNVGREKISLEELKNSLKIKQKNRLGATAPPNGLYLKEVHY
jgi:tRNA pseudouridine38-40 synthase